MNRIFFLCPILSYHGWNFYIHFINGNCKYINLLKIFQFYVVKITLTYLFMKNCKFCFYDYFTFFALMREREEESERKRERALINE